VEAIEKIEKYLGDMTLSQFAKNELVIDGVIRNFEIIGEASKAIPLAIQKAYPDIPWTQMKGMRNILIHEYFGVDVKTVWHTAKRSLPELNNSLKAILEAHKRS
jgi:uncharacterized protein with HEPN domain